MAKLTPLVGAPTFTLNYNRGIKSMFFSRQAALTNEDLKNLRDVSEGQIKSLIGCDKVTFEIDFTKMPYKNMRSINKMSFKKKRSTIKILCGNRQYSTKTLSPYDIKLYLLPLDEDKVMNMQLDADDIKYLSRRTDISDALRLWLEFQ